MEPLSLRVLLIEDNPGDADLVRERLGGGTSMQFLVDWADSLEAGQEHLAQGNTDLILLDLSLPDSLGIDTFRTIHGLAPMLPIVVLTGIDDEEVALQTLQEGGQDFVVKGPISPQLL